MTPTDVVHQTFNPVVTLSVQVLIFSAFIIVPLILMVFFWRAWVKYVRALFFASQKYVLLELRIPKGISKSPLAMELFLTSLHQTGGEGTPYDKFWLGKTRTWFSLEIVSIEGNVRFFIWSRESFQQLIESQLYGQFPDIEINKVDDYSTDLPFSWDKYNMWSCDFKKGEASHIPIKTYTSYGLDKDPKEEVKIDPITSVIEFLGSIGRGEQIWIQFVIRAHKKEIADPKTWFGKVDWKTAAKAEIDKMMKRDDKSKKSGEISFADFSMTKGERDKVEAIEKNVSKLAFDTGIRIIYVAKKDAFKGVMTPAITGSLRQYNAMNLNGFAPTNTTSFDYPWQDFTGQRTMKKKEIMMFLYRNRSFFYPEFFPDTYKYEPFVMTTEELATVYHFPGDVSRTPNLSRITAKKMEPPANLPI